MSSISQQDWDQFWSQVDALKNQLGKSKAVNVNTGDLRFGARELVQLYFRKIRSELVPLDGQQFELLQIDNLMQELLKLSNGYNSKSRYLFVLRKLRNDRVALETAREMAISSEVTPLVQAIPRSVIEDRIVETLGKLLPSACASYLQVLIDIQDRERKSFRGTAAELREILRETLDYLAPDSQVVSAPGFKLDKDRSTPTMKQKVRFILRAREMESGAKDAAEDATSMVGEDEGSLTRAVYNRGSLHLHVAPTKDKVLQLKMYVDTVLAELLELHNAQ